MKRMAVVLFAVLLSPAAAADVAFVGPVVSATRSLGGEGDAVTAIWTGAAAGTFRQDGVSAIVAAVTPSRVSVGSVSFPVTGLSASALVGRSLFVRPRAALMVGGYADIEAISAVDDAVEIGIGGGAALLLGRGTLRVYVSTSLSALSICLPDDDPFGGDRKPCPISSVGAMIGAVVSF